MFNDGYSLADIAAATGNEDGFGGGNGAWWIIILFLFCFMGGGGFWGGRGEGQNPGGPAATAGEVQNQFNFAALERQNNENIAAVNQAAYDVTGAVKDGTALTNNSIKDSYYGLNNSIRDVGALIAQNGYQASQCCCETNRNIDSVKYDALINTKELLASNCAQTQKILDAIATNRMADMQNQINQLQLQSALCGVMRYPTATTYSAGYAPYIGNVTCGC